MELRVAVGYEGQYVVREKSKRHAVDDDEIWDYKKGGFTYINKDSYLLKNTKFSSKKRC